LKIEINQPEALLNLIGSSFYLPQDRIYYPDIQSEGDNKYRFMNIFHFEGKNAIPDEHRELFLNLLSSIVKKDKVMQPEGLCAINAANYPGAHMTDLIKQFNPKYICLWGENTHLTGADVKLYGGKIAGNARMIRVDNLETLVANPELKDKTQKLLLNLFGII
jgi:hypothetical protein